MTPKEQTPDAQSENSAHGYTEGAYVQEHLSSSKEHLSTSKPESGVSEEDRKRIDQYLNETLPGYSLRAEREWVKRGIDYATKYERAKQAELVAEIERLKSQLKDYCNDCQHTAVNEHQSAELSKLREENEAKRSDLTDKLEEAVHHMDNGHTAQATTLIYEVIGELEPKGK